VAALEKYVAVRESNLQIEGMVRTVDTSHGLHLFPTKELGLLLAILIPTHAGAYHTSCAHRRLPLPEQLAIITEPSGLAGAYRAAPEVAEVWLRARPRLAAVLGGCSWSWTLGTRVDAGCTGRGVPTS
jgi:hypothetical protein